jgi:hypothetical protein
MSVLRQLALAALLCAPALAADDDTVDISSVKSKLRVVGDGKHHYLAFNPDNFLDEFLFWGDGKTFWSLRAISGGAEGNVRFDRSFWEPRTSRPHNASFDFKDGKYSVRCEDRVTDLAPVADPETRALVDGARFLRPRWKRQAYALARDNTGRYFYVDRLREPEDNKSFRLFVGQKGAMKLQKMVNVVSDSEGDIFATKTGSLRLILDKHELLWVAGKKQTKLVGLEPRDNAGLIYSELGVYAGEPLGTPCDDL